MTTKPHILPTDWQLKTPLDAIIFDCDGTLSHIEGINDLAAMSGHADRIRNLTEVAMGQTGIQPDIYAERLSLVQPKKEQIRLAGENYIQHVTEDVPEIIKLYQRHGKQIFVVSAGLRPTVCMLSQHLGIPDKNVFAVEISVDGRGDYVDFDRSSVLTGNLGKRAVVGSICQKYPRAAYVGDGMNDLPVRDQVIRFVGYGGVYYRENIASMCEYYISTLSMASLLPLTLTATERDALDPSEKKLYEKGFLALQSGGVEIHSK